MPPATPAQGSGSAHATHRGMAIIQPLSFTYDIRLTNPRRIFPGAFAE
jgi:hypothetical protein